MKKTWNQPKAIKYNFSKEMFRVEYNIKQILLQACPQLNESSGIYFLIRTDENGVNFAYIGKAVNLMQRMISHMLGSKQSIDYSLRKRGLYDKNTNTIGWRINVMFFPSVLLDEKEQYYIDKYKNAGYEMYNIESGGTNGKTLIDERKAPKTYQDGLKQGRANLAKELQHIIDLHLDVNIKKEKQNNKISINAFEKFNNLLKENIDKPNE